MKNVMESLRQDLRYALRTLRKNPGFTIVAVLTLALGIGATTSIFTVLNASLWAPLPFPEADRLVVVFDQQPNYGRAPASFEEFRDWRETASFLDALTAFDGSSAVFAGGELPEQVRVLQVARGFVELLGAPPVAGRTFAPAERRAGGPRAVVLAEGFWRSHFAGDPRVIGRTIRLDARAYTVVGVAPAPEGLRNLSHLAAYLPLEADPPWSDRGTHYLTVLGRVNEGQTIAAANSQATLLAGRLQQDGRTEHGIELVSLHEERTREARPLMFALLGAVGFVLLIVTANVASLLLARAAGREHELGVRSVLGADRARLVRQLLTEGLTLGLLGGVLGLVLGVWGADLLAAVLPSELRSSAPGGLDFRALGFSAAIALGATLLFGLAPALFGLGAIPVDVLRGGGRASGIDRVRRRTRRALVAAQLALSLVLLIGAGLMLRTLAGLLAVDPGFDPRRLVTFSINLPEARYGEPARMETFVAGLVGRIERIPGVAGAAVANHLPFGSGSMSGGMTVEGRAFDDPESEPNAQKRIVTPGYFETMHIPLRRGRTFTAADGSDSQPVIIVNETAARRLWPGEEALGKRIRSFVCSDECWEEVVGVAGDVKVGALDSDAPMQIYYPYRQAPVRALYVAVRTATDPLDVVGAIRREAAALDPLQPVFNVRTMEAILGAEVADRRVLAALIGAFAGLALLLAAAGVYGVVAYSVARRTREIGLRIALGAGGRAVLGGVLKEGLTLAAIGIAVGLAGAVATTRILSSLLYGVRPGDPLTVAGASLVLVAVAVVASYFPARRATRVDPLTALRAE